MPTSPVYLTLFDEATASYLIIVLIWSASYILTLSPHQSAFNSITEENIALCWLQHPLQSKKGLIKEILKVLDMILKAVQEPCDWWVATANIFNIKDALTQLGIKINVIDTTDFCKSTATYYV